MTAADREDDDNAAEYAEQDHVARFRHDHPDWPNREIEAHFAEKEETQPNKPTPTNPNENEPRTDI